MKKILLILLFVFCVLSSCLADRKVVSVLAIGNSFSCNAVEQHLREIAEADGVDMIIGNLYIGGCSIDKHVHNFQNNVPAYSYRKIGLDGIKVITPKYTVNEAIHDEQWDYVTVQQVSSLSGALSSYKNLQVLVAWVRENAPQAKILFHQTWAYAIGARHPDFRNYDRDQAKMTSLIQYASTRAAQEVGADRIIPCLKAVDVWRDYVPESMVTVDGYHLESRVARYLAALTWYATISGRHVYGNSYRPQSVTNAERSLAQAVADFAVFGNTKTLNSLPPLPIEGPQASIMNP